ncbi:MAG: hypothetical protein QM401_02575 [Bacillota bacterium]|nr:hypothetical protein [Bacillota bacterium]HHU62054.1 hypothetical protein [Natronincola sp.]
MTDFFSPDNLLFSPIVLAVLVVILVITLRWFVHRERMALISRGVPIENKRSKAERQKVCMAMGVFVSLLGLALTIGLATIGIGPWLLAGLIPLAIGLSLVLGSLVLKPAIVDTKEKEATEDFIEDESIPDSETIELGN